MDTMNNFIIKNLKTKMFKMVLYAVKQNISQMNVKTEKWNKKISIAQAYKHTCNEQIENSI